MDNRTYIGDLAITVPAGSTLVLTAADWPTVTDPMTELQSRKPGNLAASQLRPLLVGDITVTGSAATGDESPGRLVIDGLLIQGSVTVAPGALGRLAISNCTVVPSAGGITVQPGTGEADGNIALEIDVTQSITGPIRPRRWSSCSRSRTRSSTAAAVSPSTGRRPRSRPAPCSAPRRPRL